MRQYQKEHDSILLRFFVFCLSACVFDAEAYRRSQRNVNFLLKIKKNMTK